MPFICRTVIESQSLDSHLQEWRLLTKRTICWTTHITTTIWSKEISLWWLWSVNLTCKTDTKVRSNGWKTYWISVFGMMLGEFTIMMRPRLGVTIYRRITLHSSQFQNLDISCHMGIITFQRHSLMTLFCTSTSSAEIQIEITAQLSTKCVLLWTTAMDKSVTKASAFAHPIWRAQIARTRLILLTSNLSLMAQSGPTTSSLMLKRFHLSAQRDLFPYTSVWAWRLPLADFLMM